jgi:hypothetical protein
VLQRKFLCRGLVENFRKGESASSAHRKWVRAGFCQRALELRFTAKDFPETLTENNAALEAIDLLRLASRTGDFILCQVPRCGGMQDPRAGYVIALPQLLQLLQQWSCDPNRRVARLRVRMLIRA